MAGPHSGWPYPTGDPNKSEDEVDLEAALAYLKLRRGQNPNDIAKELGISRRTFYYRVEKLIFAQDRPSRRLMQAMEYDTLQELTLLISERIGQPASNADFAKLIGEARQLSAARRALYRLDDAPVETAEDEDDPRVDEWIAEAAEENEAQLREVRGA